MAEGVLDSQSFRKYFDNWKTTSFRSFEQELKQMDLEGKLWKLKSDYHKLVNPPEKEHTRKSSLTRGNVQWVAREKKFGGWSPYEKPQKAAAEKTWKPSHSPIGESDLGLSWAGTPAGAVPYSKPEKPEKETRVTEFDKKWELSRTIAKEKLSRDPSISEIADVYRVKFGAAGLLGCSAWGEINPELRINRGLPQFQV